MQSSRKVGAAAQGNTTAMPLRVGVDAWNLPHDHRGIGRYVREVVNAWIAFGAATASVELVIPERNVWLARGRYQRELVKPVPVRSRVRERGLDVVWFPWNGMSWDPALPAVATLHDASLFRMPPEDPAVATQEHRPFLTAASHARRIITDSQFSKEELVRFLAIQPERIEVIPLGVSAVFAAEVPLRTKRGRYLLFVGGVEARKGLALVLDAMQRLPQAARVGLELKIVGNVAGAPSAPADSRIRVERLGWVDDKTLAALYRAALALVYPSEYEGYGLPILEAMASGTPAIAAGTRSSREVGGSAAIYFPPGDADALASAIAGLAQAPSTALDQLSAAARARVRGKSWEETARKTLAVLDMATRLDLPV